MTRYVFTPEIVYDKLAAGLREITEGKRVPPFHQEDTIFCIKESVRGGGKELAFSAIQATEEEFEAMVLLQSMTRDGQPTRAIPAKCDEITLGFHEGDDYPGYETQPYLRISIRAANAAVSQNTWNHNHSFSLYKANTLQEFFTYKDGLLFSQKVFRVKTTPRPGPDVWPSTLKDLFQVSTITAKCLMVVLMELFEQGNLLWRDLKEDFLANSAYAAIPVGLVWETRSRSELLEAHYGSSMKRNNKETIGHGIFLHYAQRLVEPNEFQKLFGWDPGHLYFGRTKMGLVEPLAAYIYHNCPNVTTPVRLAHGQTATVNMSLVQDAVRQTLQLRRKVPLTFRSSTGIYEWHQEVSRILRQRDLSTVQIPKNSRFRKLKLPDNCVRLTTRKQFVEEGDFQDNCVTSYIDYVNQDACSIWSMRKEDGTRNTIEIRIRTSKNNPRGYFYIQQMFGWGNTDCDDEDYELVSDYLHRQMPMPESKK